MKYAKLINSYPQYAPNPLLDGDVYIGNPPASVYLAQGYKPVTYTPMPEAPGGYYYAETWSETDEAIVQGWELAEEPITEDEALVRYANELTGSEDGTLTEATETLIKQLKEGK